MNETGATEAREAQTPEGIPPMPTSEVLEWGDWPFLVVSDKHLSVGWQERPKKKGGPCFLVGRQSAMGTTKIAEFFPHTKEGWAQAWQFLLAHDGTLEGRIRADLAARAERNARRAELAQLNARTQVCLSGVTLLGGYIAEAEMPAGKPYDLRFMEDHLLLMLPQGVTVLLEVPYGKVEEIEVGGPGLVSRRTRGQQAGLTVAFGLIGAAVAYSDTKIQTVIRIRTAVGELFFLNTKTMPDVLRIELARPLGAIRDLTAVKPVESQGRSSKAVSMVAELKELASMLDAGLITREEFDSLKAQLLGGS